ncbi:hypothetical protein [Companilactobacillus halodurans]|uniref:Uncharacterized protein n=1 Tax=Companilactobacillus halodurans TaxID=2584183 RepID=A0A5P0ZMQ9_9LACO|nr:hypothetical protein [Companilactobacillus halodurans]MQS75121.1 hypothetical protein [Companilactobacillus halodurans]MQS97728.1 hypothetical protein [Companilactobacillus halodurans]
MKNQIIGVKFLTTSDYQDLIETPSLLSLTAGKTYAYISTGFKVHVDDLVIVPNSGYNQTPVVCAVVTNVDYQAGLEFAKKPILAVIPQEQIYQVEEYSKEVYTQLRKRETIAEELDDAYQRIKKRKEIEKLAQDDPNLKSLLRKLDKQDRIIEQLHPVVYGKLTFKNSDNNQKGNSDDNQ